MVQSRAFLRTTRESTASSVMPNMAMQAQAQPFPDAGDKIRTLKVANGRTLNERADLPTTASKLRANIYRMLDEVLETGQPLEVQRNGKTLVIAPKEEQSIWDRLPRREGFIVGDPDELIHIDWSSEWNPDPN
jgi:hypothetical protein